LLITESNTVGFANAKPSVPLVPSLGGLPLFAQGFALDLTASPLGVAMTQGQQMRLGD
jgi:hypothetical protein